MRFHFKTLFIITFENTLKSSAVPTTAYKAKCGSGIKLLNPKLIPHSIAYQIPFPINIKSSTLLKGILSQEAKKALSHGKLIIPSSIRTNFSPRRPINLSTLLAQLLENRSNLDSLVLFCSHFPNEYPTHISIKVATI